MKTNSKPASREGRERKRNYDIGQTLKWFAFRNGTEADAFLFFLRVLRVRLLSHWGPTMVAVALFATTLGAQERSSGRTPPSPNSFASFSTNLTIIRESQQQALSQARAMLGETESARDRENLQLAIKEMERSQAALDAAEKSPEKLPAAIAAQQNAYQALLKIAPHEFRMTRQRNGQGGQSSGQPQRQQLEQLEMNREENRYETERQATAAPTQQQREQLETADRLKELAQRQQDLNERLQELQTALQAARTEPEREELQRQLKRLRDEERQMLADADQLKQQLEQSSNATPEAREQMEQTRSDMQRAAQEMENGSPSGALAAGTRARQNMQNLRDDLRRRTSSQFTQQMRDLRNQARELARQQEEIARGLDSLATGQQALDNSSERQQIAQQMTHQQSALTNLLADLRAVTEQSETSEPLLSKQLYDTLRRADQSPTENLIRLGAQLVDRGFLPQASEAERAVRTNINQLRQSVERAAESVLGNEAESLRYAQRELDDLARQVERELGKNGTNAFSAGALGGSSPPDATNKLDRTVQQSQGSPANRGNPGEDSQPDGNTPSQANSGSQTQRSSQGESAANGEGQAGSPAQTASNRGGRQSGGGGRNGSSGGIANGNRLREIAEQLGRDGGLANGGPITGGDYLNWSDRLRDVEQVLDQPDLRNQLATVRERVGALRTDFRENGRAPSGEVLRNQVVAPLAQVRVWLQRELELRENPQGMVPLDRDPVPENYSELVRRYYEKLGSAE